MADWQQTAEAPGRLAASSFIAAVCTNEPVHASHVIIKGDVYLNGIEYSQKLIVNESTFAGAVDLSESRMVAGVDLRSGIWYFEKIPAGSDYLVTGFLRKGVAPFTRSCVIAGVFVLIASRGFVMVPVLEIGKGAFFSHFPPIWLFD